MNKNTFYLENFGITVTISSRLFENQRNFYQELLNLISRQDLSKNTFIFNKKTIDTLLTKKANLINELLTLKNNHIAFENKKEDIYLSFDLLSSFKVSPDSVELEFPSIITKTLANPNYNKYIDIVVCKDLKTNYSIYLYDYIIQHPQKVLGIYLPLDELKEILYIKNKYSAYSGLKNKVILPAINELQHIFKTLKYTEINDKNKVIAIKFKI
ncbi:MAG: replication initiation protein [Sulfurimonas sp.]|jgi:plasmid replication initiation protein|uniref:hypothetical protein n=1 Tax=Sulfurimonas sp. TaxID=2022749 RepID=UPI0035671200